MHKQNPNEIDWENRNQAIRTLQIIVASLVLGLLVFGSIVVLQSGFQANFRPDIMTWIGVGFFVTAVVLSFVLPPIIAQATIQPTQSESDQSNGRDRAARLFAAFLTKTIVTCALLEGAGFFNLIIYMPEGCLISIIVAVLCAAMMAARFPSRMGILHWISDHMQSS